MANREIPQPTWLSLLTRLGIPNFGKFFLQDQVVPVALVDAASASLSVVAVSPAYGTPASAGELAAPAGGVRLADTGALAPGNWAIRACIGSTSNPGHRVRVRRRNAADAADIWSCLLAVGGAAPYIVVWEARFAVASGERLVLETVDAASAGSVEQGSIFAALS